MGQAARPPEDQFCASGWSCPRPRADQRPRPAVRARRQIQSGRPSLAGYRPFCDHRASDRRRNRLADSGNARRGQGSHRACRGHMAAERVRRGRIRRQRPEATARPDAARADRSRPAAARTQAAAGQPGSATQGRRASLADLADRTLANPTRNVRRAADRPAPGNRPPGCLADLLADIQVGRRSLRTATHSDHR
jgi:hypothetical protein